MYCVFCFFWRKFSLQSLSVFFFSWWFREKKLSSLEYLNKFSSLIFPWAFVRDKNVTKKVFKGCLVDPSQYWRASLQLSGSRYWSRFWGFQHPTSPTNWAIFPSLKNTFDDFCFFANFSMGKGSNACFPPVWIQLKYLIKFREAYVFRWYFPVKRCKMGFCTNGNSIVASHKSSCRRTLRNGWSNTGRQWTFFCCWKTLG